MQVVISHNEPDDNCREVATVMWNQDVWMRLYENDKFNAGFQNKTLVFGMPSEKTEDTSGSWINIVEHFARSHGYQKIIGPMNGNTWNTYRFCTDGWEKKFFTDLENPEFYNTHLSKAGFVPAWQYVSNLQRAKDINIPFITRRDFFEKELEIVNVNPAKLATYLPDLFPVVSEIFSGNVLFSPISRQYFVSKYLEMQPFLKTGDLFLVRHRQQIVGFGLTLDDILNTKEKGMVVKTIGRIPNRQYSGVGAWISEIIYKKFQHQNYDYMVHAFMHVNNISLRISKTYQGEIIKKYAVYEKNI